MCVSNNIFDEKLHHMVEWYYQTTFTLGMLMWKFFPQFRLPAVGIEDTIKNGHFFNHVVLVVRYGFMQFIYASLWPTFEMLAELCELKPSLNSFFSVLYIIYPISLLCSKWYDRFCKMFWYLVIHLGSPMLHNLVMSANVFIAIKTIKWKIINSVKTINTWTTLFLHRIINASVFILTYVWYKFI